MAFFTDIDDAVVSKLSDQGVTCYPYESPALSKVPCATFCIDDFSADYLGVDQGFGFGEIRYKLRYYVAISKDARKSWLDLKTGILDIMEGLGADRTLGGAVRDCDVENGRIQLVETSEGARRELMCEMNVNIRPKPKIG